MKCPRCSHDNLPSAKFCQDCGTPLARACRQCGQPLPEKARYCPACGGAVEVDAAGMAPPAAPSDAPPPGERRQATLLFADIAGYTQLCTRLDAEQVQALLNRFYAAMDGTVAAYGGNVIDHAGDGVLAVFGAPIAYGNDPERALRAALAMQAAAAQLAEPVSGRALALHIGIASGEVVAAVLEGGATPKYTVTGDAVNLAARLDALAGAGETVLAASVWRSVSALVEADDLGEQTLKGYAAPSRVYRVRALRPGAAERPPFVGRQAELRQLDGVLDGLRASGAGAALLVRGDPGIGKSRLVEELASRARARGCAVHLGRVLDFGVGKSQEALPAVVAALLGLAAGASDTERRAALLRAVEAGRVGAAHEALLADLLGIEQRTELQGLFDAMDNATRLRRSAEAVAELALQAARTQPRLLVFEDLHWASPLLLGCLAQLTIATRAAPLLLAMTTRFEGDPLDRAWRSASHGTPLLTIDMGPLLPAEARLLAGGVLESSERFALQCIERAEGNPLFLEQLLRNALESDSASVPPTIQSLVLARMDRLPARDKAALQAASVIGKRFPLDALGFVHGDASYRCEALLATDLVRPESGELLFAHALIQEGVYASLLHARRRELHARAAEWYREREPALHAEHLDRAQQPAEAAAAYLGAAQGEARRYRYDEALRLAQRGAQLAAGGAPACAFALLQGDLLRELARTEDSIAAFEQALAAAGDDDARCRARLGIAAGCRVTGDIERAMRSLDEAQPLAEARDDAGARARIHSLRGNLCFAIGQVDACGREHALALAQAQRAGDDELEVSAWSGLGDHAYAEGRMRSALQHFRRCVELCRKAGLLRAEIVNTCMVGHSLNWGGEGDAGLHEIRSAVALSARLGMPQTEVMALESLAMALTLRGEVAEAEPWIERATQAARQASSRRYLSIDLLLLAHCRQAQGRRAEARTLIVEALELAQQTGIGFVGPALYATLALVSDDPAERRRCLEQGEALLAGDCLAHARLMFYRDAIDAELAAGHLEAALRYADALEACVPSEPLAVAQLGAARARALVALRRDGASAPLVAELQRLADELRRVGMGAMVRGIDGALNGA